MTSPQPAAGVPATRVTPDQGVLKALRALVDEQTRFMGQSVTGKDERTTPQGWTLQETLVLSSDVMTESIYGNFRAMPDDVRAAFPDNAAIADLDDGLRRGMARMGRLLADPGTGFSQVRATTQGVYLGLRRHWELHSCSPCNGAGRTTCQRCHGVGNLACLQCSGSRQITCSCTFGRVSCSRCHGSSIVSVSYQVTTNVYDPNTGQNNSSFRTEYRTEPCGACLGGMVTCSRCMGSHRLTCPGCSGLGTRRCDGCVGSGKIDCNNCRATGQLGTSARVGVTVALKETWAWASGCAPWVEALGQRSTVADVVTISESITADAPTTDGLHSYRVVRHGVLPADRVTARCDGTSFEAIAYGTPRRWWSGPEIVEHLLQRDVQALRSATEAAGASRLGGRPTAVLEAMGNVAQSPAHTAIVARALDPAAPAPQGVSTAYAETVQKAVSDGTRLVHRALGLDWAIKVFVLMALVGGASWLVLGTVGAALVTGTIAALGVLLRHPVMVRRLGGVYGSPDTARAAQRLAGHDHGRSWGLAGLATAALVTLMGVSLPVRGLWQPAGLRMPTWSVPSATSASPNGEDEATITTVAQALDERNHGHLFRARAALTQMAQQNVPGAIGPLSWMTLQGEGQGGFAEGGPPQGMGDRSIRQMDADRLATQAVKAGDPWGLATQGVLLLLVHQDRAGVAKLEQAASHGVGPAMVQMGRVAVHQHRLDDAQRWFANAATANDAQGMFDMGTLAWNRSNGRDSITAHSWWNRAEHLSSVVVHEPVTGLPAVARR